MDEKYAQALINSLASQRDQALNALAHMEAKLRLLEEAATKDEQKPEGPLAGKVVK
jgi:hypothetical protein